MEIKTILSCPLGHKCEEIKDGAIHRCAWFIKLAGELPDGSQADEHGCAMSWLPVLLIENARAVRGTSAAVESFRNESVKSQALALQVPRSEYLIGGGPCSTT